MKRLSLISVLLFVLATQVALGQIPQKMSYQGVLTDGNNNAVADGTYNLTFKLYDVVAGGTELWTETQSVDISNGLFNVILGAVNPLTLDFDKPYWLGITVGVGSELNPRIELASAPYSLNARSVVQSINSLKGDVTLAAGTNVTINSSDNTLTISAANGAGSGSTLDQAYDQGGAGAGRTINADAGAVHIQGADGLHVDSNVGIGTIEPEYLLEVRNSVTEDDAPAVYGVHAVTDYYGIGVQGIGGYRGVYGGVVSIGEEYYYGVYGRAIGDNNGYKRGVFGVAEDEGYNKTGVIGYAMGAGTFNIGVLGETDGEADNNYAVYANGDLVYTGDFLTASDAKVKKNVRQFTASAVSKLMGLKAREFEFASGAEFKNMNLASGKHYGFVAQELAEVFPELVTDVAHPTKDKEKGEKAEEPITYKGVKMMELIPVLVQAIQEQQATIEELKAQIAQLKN